MHHQIPPKCKIYLVGLPSVLYKTPGLNKRSMLNQLFCWFSVLFIESAGFIQKVPLFMKTNKNRSVCVYTCTIYTYMHYHIPTKMIYKMFMKTNKIGSICVYTCTIYTYIYHMHHQIPPKYKIYLVGLPSVLYERPSQNERSVLNQLFLLLFRCFTVLFMYI